MNIDERIARVRAHVEKNGDKERATFSLDGIRALLEAVDARPLASIEKRNVDEFDIAAWGVIDGHAIPVAVARKLAARINVCILAAVCDYARGATKWQPIETAPRDGTQFLALLSNGWYELLRCRADADGHYEWWTALGNVSVPIVETHPNNTDWAKSHTLLATHWMPLPAAPAKQEGGE